MPVRCGVAALAAILVLSVGDAHPAWAQAPAHRASIGGAGPRPVAPTSEHADMRSSAPALSVAASDERRRDRLARIRALLGSDPRVATFSRHSPLPTRDLPRRAFSHDAVRTASGWEVP